MKIKSSGPKARLDLVGNIGNKSDLSCALNSGGELSLMKSTVTGDTSGKNLRSFGEILSQSCDVLIVDVFNLFGAEKANFLLSAGTESLLNFLDFFIHDEILRLQVSENQNGSSSSAEISSNEPSDLGVL